ncbi:MAG: hypothetical protein ACLFU7_09890 [Armatimonadota bacterium]
MRTFVIALLSTVILLPTLAIAQTENNPLAWLDQEKLRTAYFYARPPADEKVQQLVDVGMNSMILKADIERATPYLREAKQHDGMHVFLALNFNVNAENEGFRQAVLSDGSVERYACPLEERFWQEHLLPEMLERAELANDPELQVDGLWIDFELYATVTGQRYYTNACYCDYCMSEFAEHAGVELPELDPGERKPWLEQQDLADAQTQYLQDRVEEYAVEVREQVHAVNPNLLLGFYPTPHNWSLVGVARAFSTERLPIILWATDTYGGGGPNRVPDDWREHYEQMGVNARYCAGMLLRRYSAKNLAANLYHASTKSDGYWLFTTFTLWNPVEEHSGDYYLAAGTPEEYWNAIERANTELDRLAADPAHETDLQIGIEPIVYHPLAKPELRRRVEALDPPAVTGETVEYPTVWLRGSNLLLVAGQAGRPAAIDVDFGQVGQGADAIKWEVTTTDGDRVASGEGETGEATQITFTPDRDGIHYVLISASGSKYAVTRTNAPVGLYAGARLHIIGAAERLHFAAPEGVEEFTVLGEGSSGRERVKINVYTPQGELCGTAQSGAEDFEAPVTLEPDAEAAETWSLEIARPDEQILEDNFLTLPAPLPPVVSLTPEHVFGVREGPAE